MVPVSGICELDSMLAMCFSSYKACLQCNVYSNLHDGVHCV